MLVKSPFIRARLLSAVRAGVTSLGAGLVAKGYADDSIIQGAAGLAVTLVGFWLGDYDVKTVDKKIQAATQVEPTKESGEPKSKDEIEREITKTLNKTQNKIGVGKAGW